MIKNRIVFGNYTDYRFTMTKAQGSYIWDDAGKKLLDFASGWNVTNLGWNNPEVNEAFIQQARKNVYASMWAPDKIQEDYAAAILAEYPGVDVAIRTTGGTEANEVAVKLARASTGRTKIIGFKDTYHGQLFASMALGYIPDYVRAIQPLVPDFVQMDYPAATPGDVAKDAQTLADFKTQLETILAAKDVAAIFVEPGIVTGWGACKMAPSGFVELVRELTTQYGTLMVVDEVGTGFSRTGTLFGIDRFKVTPDIATFAKAVTNGAGGLGAVLTRAELVEKTISEANYTSTFGWMPTACAAALATLAIHKRDKVWENAATLGDKFIETLRTELSPLGAVVRGMGLEVCVDLAAVPGVASSIVRNVEQTCKDNGLAIVTGDDGYDLQLMPPCNISAQDLDFGTSVLVDAIKEATKN